MDKHIDPFRFSTFDPKKTWENIENVLTSILSMGSSHKITSNEWFSTFSDVYRMHMSFNDPYGLELYKNTKLYLENHTKTIYSCLNELDDIKFGENYMNEWNTYKSAITYINKLYGSFNRCILRPCKKSFVYRYSMAQTDNLIEISKLMYKIWNDQVVTPLIDSIRKYFIIFFRSIIDENYDFKIILILRSFTYSIYICNSKYDEKLDSNFIGMISKHTDNLYRQIALNYDVKTDFLFFLSDINKILNNLFRIIKSVFLHDSEYVDKINQIISQVVLEDSMDNYIEHFSKNIDENGNIDIIEKIYKISKYSHKLSEKINSVFKEHASQNLQTLLLENLYIPKNLCISFSNKIVHYKNIISKSMKQDGDLVKKLDAAIDFSVHKLESHAHFYEIMACYLDQLLFQVIIPSKENLHNSQLKVVLRIYTLLSFKDNFNRKFLYYICNRIIEKNLAGMNESVFSQIKDVFSEDFFLTLSRIFDDYKSVVDINTNYRKKMGRSNQPDFSFTMNAVRSELWPYDIDIPIILPKLLETEYENFERFYKLEHPNRKLSFTNQESSGVINFTSNDNTYKLHLNAYQLAIFYIFNNIDNVHISEISEKTNISLQLINEYIAPFIQSNILTFDQNTKICHLNTKFSNEKKYISLAKSPSKNIEKNLMIVTKSIPELTDDGQRIAIKCSICQIIKKHGEIDFNKLIIELNRQNKYRFDINTSIVIEQLEDLKSREFILSKSDNPNVYTYIP